MIITSHLRAPGEPYRDFLGPILQDDWLTRLVDRYAVDHPRVYEEGISLPMHEQYNTTTQRELYCLPDTNTLPIITASMGVYFNPQGTMIRGGKTSIPVFKAGCLRFNFNYSFNHKNTPSTIMGGTSSCDGPISQVELRGVEVYTDADYVLHRPRAAAITAGHMTCKKTIFGLDQSDTYTPLASELRGGPDVRSIHDPKIWVRNGVFERFEYDHCVFTKRSYEKWPHGSAKILDFMKDSRIRHDPISFDFFKDEQSRMAWLFELSAMGWEFNNV